jgi:hypothetical protein
VECRRLEPEAELEHAAGPQLVELYRLLTAPAARANVLRVALLLNHGGVYQDLDTVTRKSLTPLREGSSFFCGEERLVFPAWLERSNNPVAWSAALLRTTVRDAARRSTRGVLWFQRISHFYPTAANNAVVGAEAEHPFLQELCARMLELPRKSSLRRYALGTTLLQDALSHTRTSGLTVHPPECFYPLGPELSAHWFRLDSRATLDDVLTPATRVVHWYASVRTRELVPRIDPDYVNRYKERQLLSALLHHSLYPEGSPGGLD